MVPLILVTKMLTASGTLAESDLAKFRDLIRPSAKELQFEETGWRPTFWEAVTEAQRTGKPILLWAMNGHPLGCT